MILRRLGNKSKIAKEIQQYFPPHKIYIEPFFGAGGMFFNKPKAKYNIVNDLDSDVFNLFQVVINQKEELEKAFYMMPIHSDLLEYWKEKLESDPLKKAVRFLMLSNMTFLGKGNNIVFSATGKMKALKDKFKERLNLTFNLLYDVSFNCNNFKTFIDSIEFQKDGRNDEAKTFIYADPPYISTDNNYSNSFTKKDSNDLFECLQQTGCKFAMSEFNNPFILEQAKERNLNVITIGERQNLKNRRIEILVTNYESHPTLFQ
jgi:DNA adenine methylase